jgi:hypothetical protein
MTEAKPPKAKGGARPGAGRKPSAIKLEHAALFDAAWPLERRKAAVHRLSQIAETGEDELALKAIELLLNRVYGKPTERKEVTGDGGGPIRVEAFDYATAIAPLASGSDEDSDPSSEDTSAGDG